MRYFLLYDDYPSDVLVSAWETTDNKEEEKCIWPTRMSNKWSAYIAPTDSRREVEVTKAEVFIEMI